MAAASVKPVPNHTTAATAIPHKLTCSKPSPKISLRIRHNRVGLSSRPTRNSSNVMPSSAIPIFDSALPTRPSTCGPTIAPATR